MNSNEDYLDSLLANAIQQNKETAKPISESLRSESSIPAGSSIKESVYSAIHEEKALERLLAESTEGGKTSIRESLNAKHQNSSGKGGQANSVPVAEPKMNEIADLFTEEDYNEVDSEEATDDNIEELLAAAEREGNRAAREAGLAKDAAMGKDISELFEEMGDLDASLSDIQNTLKHEDSGTFLGTLPQETDGIMIHDREPEEMAFPSEDGAEETPKGKKKRKKSSTKKNRKVAADETADAETDGAGSKPKKEKKGLFAAFKKKKTTEEPKDCSHIESDELQMTNHESAGNSNRADQSDQAAVDDIMALFQDASASANGAGPENATTSDAALEEKVDASANAPKTESAPAYEADADGAMQPEAPTSPFAPGDVTYEPLSDETLPGDDSGETQGKKKKKLPGFLQKFFSTLTEEIEEENAVPEQNDLILSDENLQVLNDLEDENAPKGKKPKKKKEKKPKKAKAAKPKKKKETPQKEEPGKKIPRKHITGTFVLAASILLVLLLLCMSLPNLLVMKDARDAYYQSNYKEAFLYMYGKKLNESDQLIYDRSRTIILLDRKLEAYRNYTAIDMPVQALDSLFQGIKRYELLSLQGEELGITGELDEIKAQILDILQRNYGISEQEAEEIIGYDPLDYTNKLESIVNGTPFEKAGDAVRAAYGLPISQNVSEESGEQIVPEERNEATELPDLLPEEQDYLRSEPQESTEPVTEDSSNEQRIPQANATVDGNDVDVYIDSDAF